MMEKFKSKGCKVRWRGFGVKGAERRVQLCFQHSSLAYSHRTEGYQFEWGWCHGGGGGGGGD